MTKTEIIQMVEEEDIEFIRLQFTDIFGNLKNVAVTSGQLDRVLENKFVFNGTEMFLDRESDEELYLYPDLDTFNILPWRPQHGKVARLLCDVKRADGTDYELSPRGILKSVIAAAKKEGYTFLIDPECEFFLFHTDENGIPTTVTHEQAGFMDVGPIDLGENTRRDMVLALEAMGFEIESSHHETAPAQHEIDFKEADTLSTADSLVTFKNAIRAVAKRSGLHATFMPKPKEGVPGSGMHIKISMYKDGVNVFDTDNDVSDEAKWFIGGVLDHAKSLCAITNPLVNSYKRIMSGYDAPKDIVWSKRRVNALVKLCKRTGESTKIELRFPDSSSNPYLTIAVSLLAGLDGVKKHTEPAAPVCYGYDSEACEHLPETLREAVRIYEANEMLRSFLGDKFTKIYSKAKLSEWHDFMNRVSDWELEKYLYRT